MAQPILAQSQLPVDQEQINPNKRKTLGTLNIPSDETSRMVEHIQESDRSTQKETTFSLAQIAKVRYSQLTVNSKTTDGQSLWHLKVAILENGWDMSQPIKVVKMPDHKYTSMDNRRLKVLKQIHREHPNIHFRVSVTLISSDNNASPRSKGQVLSRYKYLNNGPVKKARTAEVVQQVGLSQESQGHLVVARVRGTATPEKEYMGVTEADLLANSFGFNDSPLVLDPVTKQQIRQQGQQKKLFYASHKS